MTEVDDNYPLQSTFNKTDSVLLGGKLFRLYYMILYIIFVFIYLF